MLSAITTLPVVAVERTITAPPAAIFELLADPTVHPAIDGSGTVRAAGAANPARLRLGARFSMDMRMGAAYRITNTVVEFDEPERIAWRHWGGHIWRYVLTAVPEGTVVREEWDPTSVSALKQAGLRLMGFPARNRSGMVASLERLAELAAVRG
jgi:uncharacterized protein YndB with AHSA1/START domain